MRTNFNKLESRPRFGRWRGRAIRRRGIALIAVLVLFAVSLSLFGLWSRAVVRERSSLVTQQFRLQSGRLAEAGLQRAISMRAADATYADEVWSVPATELDNTHAAQVHIRESPTPDAGG